MHGSSQRCYLAPATLKLVGPAAKHWNKEGSPVGKLPLDIANEVYYLLKTKTALYQPHRQGICSTVAQMRAILYLDPERFGDKILKPIRQNRICECPLWSKNAKIAIDRYFGAGYSFKEASYGAIMELLHILISCKAEEHKKMHKGKEGRLCKKGSRYMRNNSTNYRGIRPGVNIADSFSNGSGMIMMYNLLYYLGANLSKTLQGISLIEGYVDENTIRGYRDELMRSDCAFVISTHTHEGIVEYKYKYDNKKFFGASFSDNGHFDYRNIPLKLYGNNLYYQHGEDKDGNYKLTKVEELWRVDCRERNRFIRQYEEFIRQYEEKHDLTPKTKVDDVKHPQQSSQKRSEERHTSRWI